MITATRSTILLILIKMPGLFGVVPSILAIKNRYTHIEDIKWMQLIDIPRGLVVRIPAFHAGGPGSNVWLVYCWK